MLQAGACFGALASEQVPFFVTGLLNHKDWESASPFPVRYGNILCVWGGNSFALSKINLKGKNCISLHRQGERKGI